MKIIFVWLVTLALITVLGIAVALAAVEQPVVVEGQWKANVGGHDVVITVNETHIILPAIPLVAEETRVKYKAESQGKWILLTGSEDSIDGEDVDEVGPEMSVLLAADGKDKMKTLCVGFAEKVTLVRKVGDEAKDDPVEKKE
tara:strand:- start:2589 stop:3017 length:429 start_codon:yes stop_codon:yes gene_type:complete